jgi:hypothetical protein
MLILAISKTGVLATFIGQMLDGKTSVAKSGISLRGRLRTSEYADLGERVGWQRCLRVGDVKRLNLESVGLG